MKIKILYKAAWLAALALAAGTAAEAQINNNDLLLGFTSPNAASVGGIQYDYIIDLGNLSTIQAGGASQLTLSGSQFNSATFNSDLGSAISGGTAYVGVVGASPGSVGDVILSAASQPPKSSSANFLSLAASYPNGLSLGAVSQTGNSFHENISTAPGQNGAGANNFALYAQSPLSAISISQGSGTQNIDLTLWEATYSTFSGANSYIPQGFLSFNLSGGGLGAAWNTEASPMAVPEPPPYEIFIGAGLLLVGFRRRFTSKFA